jgi:hypothetical protein
MDRSIRLKRVTFSIEINTVFPHIKFKIEEKIISESKGYKILSHIERGLFKTGTP